MTDSRVGAVSQEPPPLPLLFIVAVWLVAGLSVARYLPHLLSLAAVSVGDPGWPLAVDSLVTDGLVPTIDFGYFYGLLTIAIDRAWFATCGRTPMAAAALMVIGCTALTDGLLRFAQAARFGKWQRLLMLCAVPVAVMPLAYPTPLHAIEAALLVQALASQVRGRFAPALVLATLAVFVKPALGYFHGLALVLLLLTGRGGAPASWRERARTLIPAAGVALALALAFAIWFGIEPLISTLFPFRALQNYGDENFGFFFGTGRNFWLPPNARPIHYLLMPSGFWLAATACLTIGALLRVRRLREPISACIVTAAFLHLVFICVLFGNEWSWMYYSSLLVCGVCAVVGHTASQEAAKPARWMLPTVLAVLALLGQVLQTKYLLVFVQTWSKTPASGGLYAESEDHIAWRRWRILGQQARIMVFSPSGGTFVIFPELDSPRVWFLLKSTATPREIERVQKQLQKANFVIVSTSPQYQPPIWPEFASEWKQFEFVEETPSFRLLRRNSLR